MSKESPKGLRFQDMPGVIYPRQVLEAKTGRRYRNAYQAAELALTGEKIARRGYVLQSEWLVEKFGTLARGRDWWCRWVVGRRYVRHGYYSGRLYIKEAEAERVYMLELQRHLGYIGSPYRAQWYTSAEAATLLGYSGRSASSVARGLMTRHGIRRHTFVDGAGWRRSEVDALAAERRETRAASVPAGWVRAKDIVAAGEMKRSTLQRAIERGAVRGVIVYRGGVKECWVEPEARRQALAWRAARLEAEIGAVNNALQACAQRYSKKGERTDG